MSDTNSLDMVREYLTRKNETELRQALVKMEGGLVRLNGSKAVLIERVAHAFYGLPAGRQNEVLPGFHRARLNWQRTAHLASQVLRPPPPSAAAPPSRPPRPSAAQPAPRPPAPPSSRPTLNAATSSQGGPRGRQLLRGGRSAGDILGTDAGGAGSLGDVRGPVPAGGRLDTPRPEWGSGSLEEATMSTSIRRRRSRSMNPSPSKLLEEYKMKWTCKVCLVSEVEVILQPCGHLCLCEPCSLSIRSHFLANRVRDLMFGEPVPRTPCPICRQPIVSSAKIYV